MSYRISSFSRIAHRILGIIEFIVLHLCVTDLLDSDLVMELDRSRDLEVKIVIGGL
jgi:succinate dehydrogenase/fumarate reductase cytochrome b subunit